MVVHSGPQYCYSVGAESFIPLLPPLFCSSVPPLYSCSYVDGSFHYAHFGYIHIWHYLNLTIAFTSWPGFYCLRRLCCKKYCRETKKPKTDCRAPFYIRQRPLLKCTWDLFGIDIFNLHLRQLQVILLWAKSTPQALWDFISNPSTRHGLCR